MDAKTASENPQPTTSGAASSPHTEKELQEYRDRLKKLSQWLKPDHETDETSAIQSSPESHVADTPAADVEAIVPREDFYPPSVRELHPLEELKQTTQIVSPQQIVEKLHYPKVVDKILQDCTAHWKQLCTQLEERSQSNQLRSLMITGCHAGEGYTTVSVALAMALVKYTDLKVLLMDGDFGSIGMCNYLSINPECGIDDVLISKKELRNALVECYNPALHILPIRAQLSYPSLALKSPRLNSIMHNLRTMYDLIVVDGGCVLDKQSTVPLCTGIDACILIRHPGKSDEATLDQVEEYMVENSVACLGVIENNVDDRLDSGELSS